MQTRITIRLDAVSPQPGAPTLTTEGAVSSEAEFLAAAAAAWATFAAYNPTPEEEPQA